MSFRDRAAILSLCLIVSGCAVAKIIECNAILGLIPDRRGSCAVCPPPAKRHPVDVVGQSYIVQRVLISQPTVDSKVGITILETLDIIGGGYQKVLAARLGIDVIKVFTRWKQSSSRYFPGAVIYNKLGRVFALYDFHPHFNIEFLGRGSSSIFVPHLPLYRSGVGYLFGKFKLQCYPCPLLGIKTSPGQINLDKSSEGIYEQQASANFCPKKLPIMIGLVLCALSFMLLFKTIDYVYLETGFKVNVAVCCFFFAMTLWLVGGMTALLSLGMF
jgi:hypothetical protein